MEMLNTQVREATQNKLSQEMADKVSLVLFTQEPSRLVLPGVLRGQECLYCRETRQLLEEIISLSDKLELVVYDFVADKEKAADYGIDKIPALAVLGAGDLGLRFFGIPSGYEYLSLLEAIVDVSRGRTGLGGETKAALRTLTGDVRIQVFVTPTCPYCTMAVRLAHQCAIESPRVRGEMVEATEFPHLSQRYGVSAVPRIVMNETVILDGAVPEPIFLEHILKAAGQPKG
jgi:glutaredoxin-like protein